jgi:serine O-acetyltransferase
VSSLHLLPYALAPRRAVIDVDLQVWTREHELHGSRVLGLHTLLVEHQEFRNLFSYRVKPWSDLLRIIYSPLPTLRLNAKEIGPGFVHPARRRSEDKLTGTGSEPSAGSIKRVMIGYSSKTDRPVLRDHVGSDPDRESSAR